MDVQPHKVFVVAAALSTLLYYLLVSYRKKDSTTSVGSFLFFDRSLSANSFADTFIATGISLATVLSFFLDFGGKFGAALVVSPLSYIAGVYLLQKAVPIMSRRGFLSRGTTLHAFVGGSFGSDHLRIVLTVISLLGYLGILVIELHVGVQIFRYFNDSAAGLVAAVALLLALIYGYTWLAGYRGVVGTDTVQLRLVAAGTVAMLTGLFYLVLVRENVVAIPRDLFVPNPLALPPALLVVMLIGNIPLQLLRMSNWQRISAVGDESVVHKGLRKSITGTCVFWVLFVAAGILLAGLPQPDAAASGVLKLLTVFGGEQELFRWLLLPLVFCGLLAAMVSTADSILVVILISLLYDIRFHRELHDGGGLGVAIDPERDATLIREARASLKYLVLAVLALYVLLVVVADFDFVSLLFVFFNQQLVLFPAVVGSLGCSDLTSRSATKGLISATIVGWASVWIATIYGVYSGDQDWVFWAAPFGFGLSIIGAFAVRDSRLAFVRGLRALLATDLRTV